MVLHEQLIELETRQQAAFAAALVERMLPNYHLYWSNTEQGDYNKLRNVVDLVWQWIYDHRFKFNAATQLTKIEVAEVQVEDDASIGEYIASDCYLAVHSLLQIIATPEDKEEVLSLSQVSQATVARYLELTEALQDEDVILEHPLMQYELSLQGELCSAISATKKLDKNACNDLVSQALAENMSNIGLALD